MFNLSLLQAVSNLSLEQKQMLALIIEKDIKIDKLQKEKLVSFEKETDSNWDKLIEAGAVVHNPKEARPKYNSVGAPLNPNSKTSKVREFLRERKSATAVEIKKHLDDLFGKSYIHSSVIYNLRKAGAVKKIGFSWVLDEENDKAHLAKLNNISL